MGALLDPIIVSNIDIVVDSEVIVITMQQWLISKSRTQSKKHICVKFGNTNM
jgi:hypothetical protein